MLILVVYSFDLEFHRRKHKHGLSFFNARKTKTGITAGLVHLLDELKGKSNEGLVRPTR